MRALLDVNALISLLHYQHNFHRTAHQWWFENAQNGWASCPLTENGVIRIMSNPRYSALVHFSVADVISLIRGFIDNSDHEFWPDDVSITDKRVFDPGKVLGPGQITDVYLLGLAVRNNGVLVTFDQSISTTAIKTASSNNLIVL